MEIHVSNYIGVNPGSVPYQQQKLEFEFVATLNQTVFSGNDRYGRPLSYNPGMSDVYVNGLRLDSAEYTAETGSSITLTTGAELNDEVTIVSHGDIDFADTVPASTGGTFAGGVNFGGNIIVDETTFSVSSTTDRVGVGTSTPSKQFTVYRNSTNQDSQLQVEQDGTGDAVMSFVATGEYTYLTGLYNTDNSFRISANATDLNTDTRLTIDNAGNLAVGTTTTTSTQFTVQNDRAVNTYAQKWRNYNGASLENDVVLQFDGTVQKFGNVNNFDLAFMTNNANRMVIDTAGNVTIAGNLTVQGTQFIVDSNTVNIADNIIVLNADETGTPSQNAGIEVERGALTNVDLRWNETTDSWEFTNDGSNYTDIGAGATGGGPDQVFFENDQTVTANYTITTNKNAMTAGPITINSGVTVTIPTGSEWSIV